MEDPLAFSQLDTLWTLLAGFLVMFMQAGFLLLEIGFSRAKNAGTIVAKVLVNFAIAGLVWWAVGYGLAFGEGGWLAGGTDFFFRHAEFVATADSLVHPAAFFFFQFAFAAVSLAIVWGTTLERIKFGAYLIYAIIFTAVIYPLGAHWIFGGGWLAEIGGGVQDFAGSTVIHLVGATGALAALLLLGPRQGKYSPDGRPNVIPGHSMPLVGLGVLILWFGWFGFNPGSTISTADGRLAEVAIVTQLGAGAGVIGALIAIYARTRTYDIGMVGNGAIAGLVSITAPSGYVEYWAAPIIGLVAGFVVVTGVILIDRVLDDPVGALSAHGLAGIWGTLACGLFTSPRLAEYNGIGNAGLVYNGDFEQLGVQALGVTAAFVFVFSFSFIVFFSIKALYGLRVKPEEERYGLDLIEHGMWGYPEQFMPVPGYEYHQPAPPAGRPAPRPAPVGMTSSPPRPQETRGGAMEQAMQSTPMNKVEALVRYERLQAVQDALDEIGVSGLNVTEVKGCGRQKGYTEQYRGSRANISLLPKLKVESVVPADVTDRVVEAIVSAAYTGETGDGLLFVLPVSQAVRIRTGERGVETVRHEAPVGWGY